MVLLAQFAEVFRLLAYPVFVFFQFGGDVARDVFRDLTRGAGIKEEQADTAGEDVFQRLRHFFAHRPQGFGVEEGVIRMDFAARFGISLGKRFDRRAVAAVVAEVVAHVRRRVAMDFQLGGLAGFCP